ncbi:hypothetical protein, conserved [Plasmodium gonderi]|uniref:Uncharacterized protein n=1 Tax=Plasmodium gonderi TaxID=77519 RepID=A0A1Y1JEU2_PLAGO|nr:hypothetical protein, conserved [Plasmodium gonderi]GAW80770.1 hypothetical protein, conserved [Plasmodium gonderi]
MVDFITFLLANNEKLTSVALLESALTYYVLKRLSTLFFVEKGTNYDIEICTCKELNVNNLFNSEVLQFGTLKNEEILLKFLRTLVLPQDHADLIIRLEENLSSNTQNHLRKKKAHINSRSNRWNVYILKILFLHYNERDGKENKYFHSFVSYIISLFHEGNGVIKRRDKLLFLFLFFFLFTKKDPWKGNNKVGKYSHFNTKKGKKKKKKILNDCKKFYHQVKRKRFNKLRLRAIHKFLHNSLCHVHIIEDNSNKEKLTDGGRKKKKILILCKKSLNHLTEKCLNCLNCLNTSGTWKEKKKKKIFVKIKNELLKSVSLLKILNKINDRISHRWVSATGKRKHSSFYFPIILNKSIRSGKWDFNVVKNNFLSYYQNFLRNNIYPLLYVNTFLVQFYRSFFSSHDYKFVNWNILMDNKCSNVYANVNIVPVPNKVVCKKRFFFNTSHPCQRVPNEHTLFTLTCACICLISNNNCYNLYYLLICMLRKRKSFDLHERVNNFTNELTKLDAKCQHVWNMKNILLYMYIEMYLKNRKEIVKKEKRKMCRQSSHKIHFLSHHRERSEHDTLCRIYRKWIYKKNKKKNDSHALSNGKILKYVMNNFNFFDKILEYKSHNYMALSHISIFRQLIHFFVCKKRNNNHYKNVKIVKMMDDRFHLLARKNLYYYAVHNSLLFVYLQNVYHCLVEFLKNFYLVFIEKNFFTYNYESIRGYELCGDTWCKDSGGNKNHHQDHHNVDRSFWEDYITCNLLYKCNREKEKDINHRDIKDQSNPIFFSSYGNNLSKWKTIQLIHNEIRKGQKYEMDILNNRTGNNFVYQKGTYLEFFLFERKEEGMGKKKKKKKKNYEQVRHTTAQLLYKKIKRKILKYKFVSKEMINILNIFYGDKIYIHFYANGLRNILYCTCNCNFFFLELFYNIVVPLQLWERNNYLKRKNSAGKQPIKEEDSEKEKSQTYEKIISLLNNVDNYFKKELKNFQYEYRRFRIKYEEEKKKKKTCNFTKKINRLLKICTHVHKTWYYYNRMPKKGNKQFKGKKWISNGILTLHLNRQDNKNELTNLYLPILHNKMNKKKKRKYLHNSVIYYGIFFKCIIYTIHEYALHIYGMLRGDFFSNSKNVIYSCTNSKEKDFHHNNETTVKFRQMFSLQVNSKHSHHPKGEKEQVKWPNYIIPLKIEDIKKGNIVMNIDELNLKENLNTLHKIYLDILHFFRTMEKKKFIFIQSTRWKHIEFSKRVHKRIFFLKFLFSSYFLTFLYDHRYVLYLLQQVCKMLKYVFGWKKKHHTMVS